jgi:hypothetical protein
MREGPAPSCQTYTLVGTHLTARRLAVGRRGRRGRCRGSFGGLLPLETEGHAGELARRQPGRGAGSAPSGLAMRARLMRASWLSLACGMAACTGRQEPDRGGLMLVVAEDGSLSLDTFRVSLTANGKPLPDAPRELPHPRGRALPRTPMASETRGVMPQLWRQRRDDGREHSISTRLGSPPLIAEKQQVRREPKARNHAGCGDVDRRADLGLRSLQRVR